MTLCVCARAHLCEFKVYTFWFMPYSIVRFHLGLISFQISVSEFWRRTSVISMRASLNYTILDSYSFDHLRL